MRKKQVLGQPFFKRVAGVLGTESPSRDRSRGTPYEVRSEMGELQKSVLWTVFARGKDLQERAFPYDSVVRQHGGTLRKVSNHCYFKT